MITIQELHFYHQMVMAELAPPILCPMNELDGPMIPWADSEDKPCLWCLSCNSKMYIGLTTANQIKSLLHQ